ncbi:outer membrane beta-barrel protein [Lewinella sp. LCG006]|uniref:outer membrane beta-barrel protein n=1 Tax=Lewinella sp. LCG006 TaxID=3231911 RepID=UPI00346058E2
MNYTYTIFILFFCTTFSSAQIAFSDAHVALYTGVNVIAIEESNSLFYREGEPVVKPNFGLALNLEWEITTSVFLNIGSRIDIFHHRIENEHYDGGINPFEPFANPNSWTRNSDINYLSIGIPISTVFYYGRHKQWKISPGLFTSYRLANFSSYQQKDIERFGTINQINPDGSITYLYAELPFPIVKNSENKDFDLPSKRIQYGLTFNLGYTLFEKCNRGWRVGAQVDYYLSENKLRRYHSLKWSPSLYFETSLRTAQK